MTVSLLEASDEDYTWISNTTTDPNGRYAFENLMLGGDYMLKLGHGGVDHYKTIVTESEVTQADFNLKGTIVYSVVGSEGDPAQGLEVELINRQGYIMATSSTDDAGMGSFSPVDTEEMYMVLFYHLGIPYSKIVKFENATTSLADFGLKTTTTSDEDMEIYMHHMIAEIGEDGIRVWEGITYQNAGAEIFNNSWLQIWVNPEAEEFESEVMECCVQDTDEGVIIDPMEPIFPGERFETTLSYKLKVKSANMLLERKIDYDTGSFFIFVKQASGVGIEAVSGMTLEGERVLGGEDYLIFKGSELQRAEVASVRFKGLMSTTEVLMKSPLVWAAVILVPPVGLLVYFLRFRRAGEASVEIYDRRRRRHDSAAATARDAERQPIEEAPLHIEGPLTPEEEVDLRAEEKAIKSILEKIASDFEKGQLSVRAHENLVSKYEDRLRGVRERLRRGARVEGKK